MYRDAPSPPPAAEASLAPLPSPTRAPRRSAFEPLPHLPDAGHFAGLIERQLASCRRFGGSLAVLVIAPAEPLLPPQLAQRLLHVVGQRLRARVRASDQVVRIGDDRFGVVLLDAGEAQAAVVHARLDRMLRGPYGIDNQLIGFLPRLGHAAFSGGATGGDALVRLATPSSEVLEAP